VGIVSLGVLNNLAALYAENNLSNTSASLQKTLQQLSSGSKINSGADDAAGLSLINSLQANRQALAQSQTNALEGVGLLRVADGALSQVTSLLNRAVTLATEASNGVLNATQSVSANQEYKSILSEIDNIGKTTTYNDKQVFNSLTNIYTGDSSAAGASVDALNIKLTGRGCHAAKPQQGVDPILCAAALIQALQQVIARSAADFDEQVRLDLEYINKQSLWLDLQIAFLTPFVIVSTNGAH